MTVRGTAYGRGRDTPTSCGGSLNRRLAGRSCATSSSRRWSRSWPATMCWLCCGCRRQYLLGYFGEQLPHPCGKCDTCTTQEQHASDDEFPVNSSVRHTDWEHGVVMSDQDRLTVLFDDVGYKTLSLAAVHEHNLLTPTKSTS
ncbi:MAG TPA: RecQ family zinc-binding domain-containing protein [Pseudonocardiaceae bacterium]